MAKKNQAKSCLAQVGLGHLCSSYPPFTLIQRPLQKFRHFCKWWSLNSFFDFKLKSCGSRWNPSAFIHVCRSTWSVIGTLTFSNIHIILIALYVLRTFFCYYCLFCSISISLIYTLHFFCTLYKPELKMTEELLKRFFKKCCLFS